MMLLILFTTLIIPNLFLSFISISCSTGLNKKLLKVIINYPATLMLPIATFFTIGPYKSNCCSQINVNRNLGLSKVFSYVNILLSLIMYLALQILFIISDSNSFSVLLGVWSPPLVIVLVINITYLNIDKQCCGSNCCCQDSVVTHHVINVNHDDLKIVTIENNWVFWFVTRKIVNENI